MFVFSWLLHQVLNALGYSHISEYSSALVHTSFASQLESHGLWHWAIFVLLHLKNKQRSVILNLGVHFCLLYISQLSASAHAKIFLPIIGIVDLCSVCYNELDFLC